MIEDREAPLQSILHSPSNLTLDDGFGNAVIKQYTVDIYVPRNYPAAIKLEGPYSADAHSAAEFQASAIDREGDPLTWVFDFGDGSPIEVYHTAGAVNVTVWNNVTHVFESTGSYKVVMNVSDVAVINPGSPHNTSVSLTIQIVENRPPGVSDRIMVSDENPVINSTLGYALVVMTVEAADLDGASWWQRLWYISVPMVSPITLFTLVTGMIAMFQ